MADKIKASQIRDMIAEQVGRSVDQIRQEMADNRVQRSEALRDVLAAREERTAKARELRYEKPGAKAAAWLRWIGAARGDVRAAQAMAERAGDKIMARALGESVLADGGALVPPDFAEEVVEFLRADSVVMQAGTVSVPMPLGTLNLRRVTGGSTASYIGESKTITKSQLTFGLLKLSARKLAALVPQSRELAHDTSGRSDDIIMRDMRSSIAAKMDIALIRSNGASDEPKGLLHWADGAHKFNAAGDTLADITNDLGKQQQFLDEADVPVVSRAYLMAPRSKRRLMTIRDSDGAFAFRDEMVRDGTLMGFPFFVTSQIPKNLGGGTNESEVYFADFGHLILAETDQITAETSSEASYTDGASLVSAFERDELVHKMTLRHDFGPRYLGKEISVIQAVNWGA